MVFKRDYRAAEQGLRREKKELSAEARAKDLFDKINAEILSVSTFMEDDGSPGLEKHWEGLTDAFMFLSKFEREKAEYLLGVDLIQDEVFLFPEDEVVKMVQNIKKVLERPALKTVFTDLMNNSSTDIVEQFLNKSLGNGVDAAESFFKAKEDVWTKSPDLHERVMEEFLIDEDRARILAEEFLLEHPDIIDMPEHEEGVAAVELVIPTLSYDPKWYAENKPKMYNPDTGDKLISDDKDYALPYEFARYKNPENPFTAVDTSRMYVALKEEDFEAIEEIATEKLGLGPIPPEKFKVIKKTFSLLARAWGITPEEKPTKEVEVLKNRMERIRTMIFMPESAKPLRVYNRSLDMERTLPSFEESLHRQMMETILIITAEEARRGNTDAGEISREVLKAEAQARALYKSVSRTGVPVFKDFINWLNVEAEIANLADEEHPGEFYVGRDTQTTLYTAAKTMRWGKMRGAKNRELTVFVNVSRVLAENMDKTKETREMMRDWLKKEGATRDMLGIDGGYKGTSPTDVFLALDPNIKMKKLNQQIKLIETQFPERRFNDEVAYDGVVGWMERLPKFTERAKEVQKTDFGKFYVASEQRSPVERMLAWTVQHTVWRELINHEPIVLLE